jgi:putative endonuclease
LRRIDGGMGDAWVYMLQCADGSLYTGWTSDLDRRLARHSAGKASRYTASRLPVELAVAWQVTDRSSAMREEARIKRLDRARKLALVYRTDSNTALSTRLDRPDLALHDIDGENPALARLSGISRSEMPRNRLKLPNRQSSTKR